MSYKKGKLDIEITEKDGKVLITYKKTKAKVKTPTHILNTYKRPISKYDISNGFMLANLFHKNVEDSIQSISDSSNESISLNRGVLDPIGWWHSEKYDGVRVIWDCVNFYTRNQNIICAPDWFKSKMPQDTPLDGELFIKRNDFNHTSGIVRRHNPRTEDWKKIKFMVFDLPASNKLIEERFNLLEIIVSKYGPPLYFVKQTKIKSLIHLSLLHQKLVSELAEGSIIREPKSRYIPGRSNRILKVKNYSDEDAVILDWDEGNGSNRGKLGAIWVRWADPVIICKRYQLSEIPYVQFRVGSGFKADERCKIEAAPESYPSGTIVKVGFCGLQLSGKPRHPTFKGIRE